MSPRLYRRCDGVMFVVMATGEVYEVRRAGISPEMLERAEAAGLVTPGADPCLNALADEPPSPRQSRAAPQRLRVVR